MIKIAIDGPSGSGKSTLARSLAKKLGYTYVDTGALYRAVALFMTENKVDLDSSDRICARLADISLSIVYSEDGTQHVYLCGEDVSEKIRTSEISMAASKVSAIPAVRNFLLETQRNIAESANVIMDGRDIGTVIFPDADVKIFLTAGNESRAERRYAELIGKGENITFQKVLEDMGKRDQNDSSRAVAPAIPADDAVILDNTEFTKEMTFDRALEIISQKLRERNGKM